MTGSQLSKQAFGPSFSSQIKARWWLPDPRQRFTALCVPQPIHQLNMPPSVLPAVATKMAGQNSSGLSLTKPNSTGSEPIGNKVAEMKATTNTVLRPCCGRASHCINSLSQSSMGAVYRR